MRLLNVRLGPDDAVLVKRLRRRGVEISKVVREAIRAAAGPNRKLSARDVDRALDEIYARHPDPSGSAPLPVAARDRRALRAHVQERLRRTRRP